MQMARSEWPSFFLRFCGSRVALFVLKAINIEKKSKTDKTLV